jgi:hypothetical protein
MRVFRYSRLERSEWGAEQVPLGYLSLCELKRRTYKVGANAFHSSVPLPHNSATFHGLSR